MQIEPISSEVLASHIAPLSEGGAIAKDAPTNFSSMVSQGLEQVNQQLLTSEADLQTLASGNVQNLHQIMIRMEESRLSFQLLLQVRNRLLESYQDIMKMQI